MSEAISEKWIRGGDRSKKSYSLYTFGMRQSQNELGDWWLNPQPDDCRTGFPKIITSSPV